MFDIIFALASARGKAGISVFRISGPGAFNLAAQLCGNVPLQRGIRVLKHSGHFLDRALVLSF